MRGWMGPATGDRRGYRARTGAWHTQRGGRATLLDMTWREQLGSHAKGLLETVGTLVLDVTTSGSVAGSTSPFGGKSKILQAPELSLPVFAGALVSDDFDPRATTIKRGGVRVSTREDLTAPSHHPPHQHLHRSTLAFTTNNDSPKRLAYTEGRPKEAILAVEDGIAHHFRGQGVRTGIPRSTLWSPISGSVSPSGGRLKPLQKLLSDHQETVHRV